MSAELEYKTVYEPSALTVRADPKIPKITYDTEKEKFKGDTLSKGTDCFPTIIDGISVPKGDREPWYVGPGLCVRLETYGGGAVDAGSDLCCLFHSCGKSLLPDLAHISTPFTTKNDQTEGSYIVCHNFKADLATYCLSDTVEGQENKRPLLERNIKLRHTLFNGTTVNVFMENIRQRLKDIDIKPEKYASDCLNAIAERGNLLKERETLREQKRKLPKGEERSAIKAALEAIQNSLISPSSAYNTMLGFIEESYLDPREEIISTQTSYGWYKQYFWPPEIRKLPLTMGLFAMGLFEYNEWDIREQDLGATYAPTGGRINLQTVIDQLLSKMTYGLDYFRLIAFVTGFTIFMVTPEGEPHEQYVVTRPPLKEDMVQLVASKLINSAEPYAALEYDEEAPCIVISYEKLHFENVALLHEMEVAETKQVVFQAQSVFSFHDPFIQSIIARFRSMNVPTGEAKGVTVTPIAPVRIPVPVAKTPVLRTPKPEAKPSPEPETKGEVDFSVMDSNDIMKHLEKTVPGIRSIYVSKDDFRAYARQVRDDAVKAKQKKAASKKKKEMEEDEEEEEEEKSKEVDISTMTVKQLMAYWDKTQPQWREGIEALGENPAEQAKAELEAAKAKVKAKAKAKSSRATTRT